MTDLPPGLDQALSAVAGELGMASASWVFVRAVARCSGDEAVAKLAEEVGPEFVVLEAIARAWLAGEHEPKTDTAKVIEAIGKATRVVVVGLEVAWLDRLLDKLPASVKIALVTHSGFPVDCSMIRAITPLETSAPFSSFSTNGSSSPRTNACRGAVGSKAMTGSPPLGSP